MATIITPEEFQKLRVTGQGVTQDSGGRQQYTDDRGGLYRRNEYNVGTPDYRTDYEVVQAPRAPAPTGNPIVDSGVRRYSTTGGNSAYESERDSYYAGLNTEVPDRNAIYQEQVKRMQAQIDAINNVYSGLISQEEERGVDRLGRTRAASARGGVLGDDFGNAAKEETIDYNTEKVGLIKERQARDIAAIFDKINQRSDTQYLQDRELALTNKEKKLNYYKELETEARNDLKALASTGVSLDDLTQEEYDKLLQQTGYDTLEFESIFNAAKSLADRVDYTYHNLGGGKVLRTGVDGKGAAVAEQIFDYGTPEGYELKETKDGTLFLFNPDTGEIQNKGNFGKSTGGSSEEGFEFTNKNVGELLNAGLNREYISYIEKGVNDYGLDAVLEAEKDLTEAQKSAIRRVYGGDATQFLNADYIKDLLGDDAFRSAARDAGFKLKGTGKFLGIGKDTDYEGYKEYLDGVIAQYRDAGYTDQQILKLMQS